jgi:hydroxymethylglutaryl-CoA reductase (NADPH)
MPERSSSKPSAPATTRADAYDDAMPRIPHRGHYSRDRAEDRLEWVRRQTGAPLTELGEYRLDPEQLRGNVENFIGMTQVPVGVAGPLLVRGEHIDEYVMAPFATTEGALVASVSRGARALSLAGGVRARVVHQQMIRAPMFTCATMDDAFRLQHWLEAHLDDLRAAVRAASRRGELTAVRFFVTGAVLHTRFLYRTADAAGQNMTTAATHRACQWIIRNLPADIRLDHHVIEGNFSSDKKVSFLSYIEGRGTRVVAEARLTAEVLREVLKVEAADLLRTWSGFVAGSVGAGMIGMNVNVANTIGALFTATGQDIACVHESSVGQLDIRPDGDDIYVSLMLPSLIIGTVGGGTGLPTQREALEMMGCYGPGKAARLAEIMASFALALDLSTLSAIAAGHFAAAHERLGRNKPDLGLKAEDFGESLFERLLGGDGAPVKVESAEPIPLDTSASILSDLAATELNNKRVGLFPYEIHYTREGKKEETRLVLKVKATDGEVVGALNKMAQGCGSALAGAFERLGMQSDFRGCHDRELAIARLHRKEFTRIAPRIHGTWRSPDREIYVIAMELLEDVTHVGTADRPEVWKRADISAVLEDLAPFHALHLGRTVSLPEKLYLFPRTTRRTAELSDLWRALADHGAVEFPATYTPERRRMVHALIDSVGEWWPQLEAMPRTLVHNDFNPRNLCLRPDGHPARLCVYDWELATVNVPQADVAEFLAFVLPPTMSRKERLGWCDEYRTALETASGVPLDEEQFRAGFDLACADLLIGRLGLYAMAHTYKDYTFLPRVLDGVFRHIAASPVLAPFIR